MRRAAVIDFETTAIDRSPRRVAGAPRPVGVAVRTGSSCRYHAWGHPEGNNTTERDARRVLADLWSTHDLVFHNASFDISVAMTHFDLPWPEHVHDTLVLAYLHDPRDETYALKPLAEKYLHEPPEERDRLRDWIVEEIMKPRKIRAYGSWGAYIAEAPAGLVGEYAKGDVERTWGLYRFFAPVRREMAQAYAREMAVLRVKQRMEAGGIRVDTARLEKDIPAYERLSGNLERSIRKKLGDEVDLASGPQLAARLGELGYIRDEDWIYTAKGNKSTSRANLEQMVHDKALVELLALHGVVEKYLSTFLRPWYDGARANGGAIHPEFNTVRGEERYGTRTGRLSSSNPNFQNIPASVEGSVHQDLLRKLRARLKRYGVELIGLRDYLVPDKECVFLDRDYSQQEFRIFAHYEDGGVLEQYHDDPDIDFHTAVQRKVMDATGIEYPRKTIKNINFGLLYGMGGALLARMIGCTEEEARSLRSTVLDLVPGIRALNDGLKGLARRDEPMVTWGGRVYYCEPPKMLPGRGMVSFDYKMLNTLVQGSAADCTKQAMVQVDGMLDHGRIVLQVHDELLVSAEKGHAEEMMRRMKEGMEAVDFDVPLLTDGKWGPAGESWARLVDYEE